MKRLITAIILLTLVIAACIGTYFYIRQTTSMLDVSVATAQMQAQTDDIAGAHETMMENYAAWRQHHGILSTLVRHNEIDETERLYQRTLQALENADREEALMQLAELRTLLRHLPEMEKPNFPNVL